MDKQRDALVEHAKYIAEILGQDAFWISPDKSGFASNTLRALVARLQAAEKLLDSLDFEDLLSEREEIMIETWRAIRDAKEGT